MGRKAFIVMLVLALIVGLSMAVMAQEAKKKHRERAKGEKSQGHLPPGLEELGLTDDQKAKVQQAAADMQAKLKAIKESGAMGDDAKQKHMEARKAFDEQLKTILTEEQMTKLEEQRKAKGKAGGEKKQK